jgi:hypothetical protein
VSWSGRYPPRASSWSLVCKAAAAILLLSQATACATHSKPVASKPVGSIAVIPAIRSSFAIGSLEIAKRMSEQISGAIQHANVVAAKQAQ